MKRKKINVYFIQIMIYMEIAQNVQKAVYFTVSKDGIKKVQGTLHTKRINAQKT